MKVRKRPMEITAWYVDDLLRAYKLGEHTLPKRLRDAIDSGEVAFFDEYISVLTMEGRHKAYSGNLLMCGVHDELYGCDRQVFEDSYDIVEEVIGGTDGQEDRSEEARSIDS